MDITGLTDIPDSIKKKAYKSFRFDDSAREEDKMIIRQVEYTDKHGEFNINVEETDSDLICKLTIDEEMYTCEIPLEYDSVTSEVYPFGDVKFENVKLLAVSFYEQSDWANETYSVHYWCEPTDIDEPFIKDNIRILRQFYLPRNLKTDTQPLPEIVNCNSDNTTINFLPCDVHNYTHCKMPNPWAKYSMGVLYENEELANKLFEHDRLYGSKDNYRLTPPNEF